MGKRGPRPRFDLDKIRHLLTTHTPTQLARELGCARSTAYELANRAGVKLRTNGPIDPERRARWVKALAEEPNLSAAGRRMGVSRQAASRMAARIEREASEAEVETSE